MFQSTINNQENKANNQKSPIYASSIPSVTLPIHNNQLAEPNTDSNCNTSNVSFGDKDSPSPVSQSTVVSPKQLSASKLSSVIQRSRQLANKEGTNKGQNLALKSSIPCPFLIRRGRCLKGNRCDFKHPKPSKAPKNIIPCPLLQKRGYCLKMNRCDFSHKSLTPKNTSPKPRLDNYTHHNPFFIPPSSQPQSFPDSSELLSGPMQGDFQLFQFL